MSALSLQDKPGSSSLPMPVAQLLNRMQARRLCRLVLRCWMGLIIVLGLSCHSYSPNRLRRLKHSRLLQIYSWLMMALTLGVHIPFWRHAQVYFAKGTFRRQGFVVQMSMGSVVIQLLALIIHTVLRLKYEGKVCQVYNELSEILRQDLGGQNKRSRFYYVMIFAKFHNYLHNFNCALSILMILDMRRVGIADLLANFYFVYCSLARDSDLFVYVLLILDLSEALHLNSKQEQDSYGRLMAQLRRQERLLFLERQVHRMFAWLVAPALFFQMFYNTGTIYLAYAFIIQRKVDVGLRLWTLNLKVILIIVSLVVKLSDCLLLQIACEHLLRRGNRLCESPKVCDQVAKAAQRQWELSILRRAIRVTSKDYRVLGLFRLDMRCAFALLSSSLAYGVIIIQMGYVHI